MTDVQALVRRMEPLRPALTWSIRFAGEGPRWLPSPLRRVPLTCLAAWCRVQLWGMRHGF